MSGKQVFLYDTTLRDGAQAEDISFSLEDKLRITRRLDEFGIHYIEGGWPGANPKDAAFFEEARKLPLKKARLSAFGSTRRAKKKAAADDNLRALVRAGTPVVTLFGKSWDRERGTTFLLATHDPAVMARAPRVVRLRDGQIAAEGDV